MARRLQLAGEQCAATAAEDGRHETGLHMRHYCAYRWPYMCALGQVQPSDQTVGLNQQDCGATLVAPQVVLTGGRRVGMASSCLRLQSAYSELCAISNL
jgi:hypothetical protein